jgi:hypothetical protein
VLANSFGLASGSEELEDQVPPSLRAPQMHQKNAREGGPAVPRQWHYAGMVQGGCDDENDAGSDLRASVDDDWQAKTRPAGGCIQRAPV